MTPDRLRELADEVEAEVTPGDPNWLVSDDDIDVRAHSAAPRQERRAAAGSPA